MFDFLSDALSSVRETASSLWSGPSPAPQAEAAPAAAVASPAPAAQPAGAPAPAAPPVVDQAAMSRAASQIFAAADGWGTNEEAIHAALRGRSPAEVAAIRAEYQNHYGVSLDSVISEELSGDDLAAAQAALTADPVQAAAATLVNAASGLGTDEDAIMTTLRGIGDPAVRAQVEAEYERRTGQSLSTMLADELGGTDAQVATALAGGRTDEADAMLLEEAMSGMGTDEEGINTVLERCADQAARDRVMAAYEQRTGRSLGADMSDEMSGTDLQLSTSLSRGDAAGAAAVRIQAAAEGLGTDEDAIFRQLEVADPAQRRAIIDAYNQRFGSGAGGADLNDMLRDELGTMDQTRATQLAENGRLDPVFAMRYAMDGIGTDEDMMRSAMSNLSPEQAAQVRSDYAAQYGGDLEEEMRGELSGRDEFYLTQSLGGERGLSVDERLRRADAAHDFERGSGAGIFGGFTDVFFDAGEQLDAQHERLGALREQMNGAGTPEARAAAEREIERVHGDQQADQVAYHAAQDSVANGAATAGAIVATVAITAATGGLGAGAAVPALASFMGSAAAATGIGATSLAMGAGALAGGLVSMGVKRAVSGDAYGAEAAGLDLAMTGVNALTAGAMASGAAVQGLPALLAQRGLGAVGGVGNTMATQVVQGVGQGLISGTASGLLDERTWRGPGNGVGNLLSTIGVSVLGNVAGGALQTVAGAAVGDAGMDLFDPATIGGSFATGAIGGAAGGFAQTALGGGAFDGRWEDVLGRFGNSMGTGAIQSGLMSAGQTVSQQRLEAPAQTMGAGEPHPVAAPAVNPADAIPADVIPGLPPEVQAVIQQAREHPPGTGPRDAASAPNPADLAAFGPEVARQVEAAQPVVAAAQDARTSGAPPAAPVPVPLPAVAEPVAPARPPAPTDTEVRVAAQTPALAAADPAVTRVASEHAEAGPILAARPELAPALEQTPALAPVVAAAPELAEGLAQRPGAPENQALAAAAQDGPRVALPEGTPVQAETPGARAPLTPEDAFRLAREANYEDPRNGPPDPARVEARERARAELAERLPELLAAQTEARMAPEGDARQLQSTREGFERALALSPEVEAAIAPALDVMCEKAFDFMARMGGGDLDAAIGRLGADPITGLAGAVGRDPSTMLEVLVSGNVRERAIALGNFQQILAAEALRPATLDADGNVIRPSGMDELRATFGGEAPEGAPAVRFGADDLDRLATRVEDFHEANPGSRDVKRFLGAGAEDPVFRGAKAQNMDDKLPSMPAEVAQARHGDQPAQAGTSLTGAGERSALARSTDTMADMANSGIVLSPREREAALRAHAATHGLDPAAVLANPPPDSEIVMPWNTGTVANMVNPDAPFIADAADAAMPLKAGISGNTYRFMRLAEAMGIDPAIARLACMSQLIPIEAHSFHEIAMAAQDFQTPGRPGASTDAPGSVYDQNMPYSPASTGLSEAQLLEIMLRNGLMPSDLNGPAGTAP